MKQGYKLRVITHDDMTPDDNACIGAFLGAPLVGIEKITTGNEVLNAVECVQ